MSDSNRLIVAAAIVAVTVAAFWFMLLAPKREEATQISTKVDALEAKVAQVRQQADAAEAAKDGFAEDYEQLVLLGKAVPGDEDTASLLVQLDEVAKQAGVEFQSLQLGESGDTAAAAPAAAPAPPAPAAEGAPVVAPPTEASASTLPIGAAIGEAGLAVMPYNLSFQGEFFEIADFIKGLDDLVKTTNGQLAADGRLITVDAFGLEVDDKAGFPVLQANFSVKTYLTPAGQGVTAGATPVAPAPVSTTPPATTTTTP